MSAWLRPISKLFRVGRARYLVGHDLEKNAYYELPNAFGSTDPRHTRRMIEYSQPRKTMAEHIEDQKRIPVQWSLWLRHTRQDPPSLEELQNDAERMRVTQHNARILEARYAEQRERRAQLQRAEHDAAVSGLLGSDAGNGAPAAGEDAKPESMRIRPSAPGASSAAAPSSGRRAAASVPTASVSDADADAERDARVLSEQELGAGGVRQERMPDQDVWAASRQRIEQAGGIGASGSAQTSAGDPSRGSPTSPSDFDAAAERRAQRRQAQSREAQERERARAEMGKSVLSAFDVDFQDEPGDGVQSARLSPAARKR